MAEGNLAGQAVLVTGATGGIGSATIARLAALGAVVWISDLKQDACEDAAELLRSGGAKAHAIGLDVAAESDWIEVVDRIRAEPEPLTVLVNNAGIGNAQATVADEDLVAYQHIVDVTQTGVFLGMKHAGALIEQNGGGSIVNICSILGTVGGFGKSFSYHAAKGAVRTMTKTAAVYWAERGIRVNSVHPGFIGTPTQIERWAGSERGELMVGGTPMKRLGTPDEVAGVIAFLAGPDSSYVTGSELDRKSVV